MREGTLPTEPSDVARNPVTRERDLQLANVLQAMLYGVESKTAGMHAAVERLERIHGAAVYAELIFLLCHLQFEEQEAKDYWQQVLRHRDGMQELLGSPLDLRVALASYFLEVNRKLDNPKLIELELFEQTQASVYRDELTDLHNYRFFSEFIRYEILRAGRTNVPLSLVMFDVDDFKQYNDRNGHETGNVALQEIARILKGSLREAEMAARYGGEEFALILPSTSKTEARLIAERIRGAVEHHDFPDERPRGTLTVSMGVATFPADAREAGELIRCADRAMYTAKAQGKNLVSLFGESCRSYRRVDANVAGVFQVATGESIPLTCVNLSERGVRFVTKCDPPSGALIEVTFEAPAPYGPIRLAGRVVQVTRDGDHSMVGVRIVDMDPTDQRRLLAYVASTGEGSPE